MSEIETYRSCPSAQPTQQDARVIGVVLGEIDRPEVAYLERDVAVTDEDLGALGDVRPTRILRFAARCESSSCGQFKDGACGLGRAIAALVPSVDAKPPACSIRKTCRWFAENGPPICLRCSRVVTDALEGDAALMRVAMVDPSNRGPGIRTG